MLVLVEARDLVVDGFSSLFKREGVCITGLGPAEFRAWFSALPEGDLNAIEGILIGDCDERLALGRMIAARTRAPLFALLDMHRLEETLRLLDEGFDDVLRKPIHVREILARMCRRRAQLRSLAPDLDTAPVRVFLDGREPEVAGRKLDLPRRERRILEVLFVNAGRRISKAQLFSAVYGLDDEAIEETVIESHVSKLRKKLRGMLGYDPIDSQRFLGYCWQGSVAATVSEMRPRSAQVMAA
ncbi:MAG: response regulator transcription factor [Phyllobacteriaceae bacterium]|nr:response regulator transcription factor [Phyllobacteriaceae bacterium]